MQTSELRQKMQEELEVILIESRNKLRELRFSISEGKVKNIRELHDLKKIIAQILTIQKEKK